jgi:hypothetical protein
MAEVCGGHYTQTAPAVIWICRVIGWMAASEASLGEPAFLFGTGAGEASRPRLSRGPGVLSPHPFPHATLAAMADHAPTKRRTGMLSRTVRRDRAPVSRPPGTTPQRPYDRRTELPRVLPLWPRELDDETFEGRQRILAKLRRALRAERRRGLAGHWTYDLARHVELLRVYRLELAAERRE